MDLQIQKCIDLLNRYKYELTYEQYKQNLSIIGNSAIEGMYLDEEDIFDLIRIDRGEDSEDIMNEKLRAWGVK
ncbi:hypothetical protein [Campylobacter sp. LR286c]|uniref:hypothetical protein n=1 Tax=Campylobacter sp. LR286c TaxID=2593545 RepID=UPI00123824DA|nr:hypothetical protein [Campylobacter sp. LR286c]KAA6225725.1 hypothetical protein FMM57_07535 [Campylobacter sp. LR286c]